MDARKQNGCQKTKCMLENKMEENKMDARKLNGRQKTKWKLEKRNDK